MRTLPKLVVVLLLAMMAALFAGAATASASLQLVKPDPNVAATFRGNGGYSSDGLGQSVVGGTVQAEVPAGSTIVHAYLYGTYTYQTVPDVAASTIDFDGTNVVMSALPHSGTNFTTTRAEVTSQVAAKIGMLGGIFNFQINNDPDGLDGVALVVVYSNPSSPLITIAILDGGAETTGDTATFNFLSPLDKSTPGFAATMAVGSGFSYQGGTNPHDCAGVQYSTIDVNTNRLTSCAGNYDDGEGADGALITVGGVGDSTDNPADPAATSSGTDDELYDLAPKLANGDTSVKIDTANPSGDDNLFLAVIATTAAAAVTTEVCNNSTDDDGDTLIDLDDPDCQPRMSIDDVTVTEGDSGTKTATFKATLSSPINRVVTAHYDTANDTATAGSDYVAASGTVTFPANVTTQDVTVTINGDTVPEPDETYFVNLSTPSNATIQDAQGLGTITNDDVGSAFSVDDVTVAEGDAGTVNATFTVSRTNAGTGPASVNFATADNTATSADYTANSGTVSFLTGESSKQVTVVVKGDTLDEVDETFFVNLSGASAGAGIADSQGVGTITDDDGPPTVSIGDVTKAEGNAGTSNATLTVTLSAASGKTVTVNYTTSPNSASAGADYTTTSGTLTFTPGQTSSTIDVPVAGDTIDEPDETFFVDLSSPSNVTVNDGHGVGTITDDDNPPAISIDDVSVNEGNSGTTNAVFTVTLSNPSSTQITVNYATAGGSATAGTDFQSASGTLTFAPGETSKQVTVAVVGDTGVEPDETFTVGLANVSSNASIADASGAGTIRNDDAPPVTPVVPAISINDVVVNPEGNTGTAPSTPAVFTVKLSAATTVPVSVTVGTANGTAVSPADFGGGSGPLTFAPGETTKTVPIAVVGDTVDESDETFTVNLSAASNATIGDAQGVGTIVDDDLAILLPPVVDGSDLFCGAQHRGKCNGIPVKGILDRPGNASWTFAAYNPNPGGGSGKHRAAAAASKKLALGTVKRTIKKAGTVSFVFKLKKGARTNRLYKKVKAGKMSAIDVKETFTAANGQKTTTVKTIRLRYGR